MSLHGLRQGPIDYLPQGIYYIGTHRRKKDHAITGPMHQSQVLHASWDHFMFLERLERLDEALVSVLIPNPPKLPSFANAEGGRP